MKYLGAYVVVVLALSYLAGCSSTQRLQHPPVSAVNSAPPYGQKPKVEEPSIAADGDNDRRAQTPYGYSLFYMAELLETSYLEPAKAIQAFNQQGFNATYFAPKYKVFFNFPEVYLLSQARSQQVLVLFVGTNSVGDWIENNNSSVSKDEKSASQYYVPQGHKGFRNGIVHLAKKGFFDEVLPAHVARYGVSDGSGQKIRLVVAGHSQGAGLAQLASPALAGFNHINGGIARVADWPFTVSNIYSYAPPYAIAHQGHAWQFMQDHFGNKTYQIIRDSDFITTVYSVTRFGHHVPYRHFGHYVRITRDDIVVLEPTFWGSQVSAPHQSQPHQLSGYRHALQQEGL